MLKIGNESSPAVHQQASSSDDGDITTGKKSVLHAQVDESIVPDIGMHEEKRGTCTAAVEAGAKRGASCRRAAKLLISHDWFDRSVVGLILINCVFLALDDPTLEASA